MFEFSYPWVFLLLPVPLLVRWLVPPYRQMDTALRLPFFPQIAEATGIEPTAGAVVARRTRLQIFALTVTWLLCLTALARPVLLGEPVERTEAARDVLVVLDISGSMETPDFTNPDGTRATRLAAVKQVLRDFVGRSEGDRVGLIVFGSAPYVQAPFTTDLETVTGLVDGIDVNMAGPQTMIGDAIALGLLLFEESGTRDRLMILMTDGADTGSRVTPVAAAEIAARNGVTIYTIGVGAAQGPEPQDRVDHEALAQIAGATGGGFFLADERARLETIYRAIERLEPREVNKTVFRSRTPVFHWPLGLALVIALIFYVERLIAEFRRPAEDGEVAHG